MIESMCSPLEVSKIEVKGLTPIVVSGELCYCNVQSRPVTTADGMIHINPQGKLYRAKLEASGDFRKIKSADSEITLSFSEPEVVMKELKMNGLIEVVYGKEDDVSIITVTESSDSVRFGKNVCSECPVK